MTLVRSRISEEGDEPGFDVGEADKDGEHTHDD